MTPATTAMTDDKLKAPSLDPRTRTAIAAVGAFGAMFAITGAAAWGARTGLSVAAGAAVAMLNLYGLAKILGAMVAGRAGAGEEDGRAAQEDGASSAMWGLFALVKVFALFGGVWLLMSAKIVDPLPLVVGWGALPVGIAIGSLLSDKTARSSATRAKEAPRE
jgi:hypothetical protein